MLKGNALVFKVGSTKQGAVSKPKIFWKLNCGSYCVHVGVQSPGFLGFWCLLLFMVLPIRSRLPAVPRSHGHYTPLVPRANSTKAQMLMDDDFCIKTIFRHGGNAILRHHSKRHRCRNRCRENNCRLPAITMTENEVPSRYLFQV